MKNKTKIMITVLLAAIIIALVPTALAAPSQSTMLYLNRDVGCTFYTDSVLYYRFTPSSTGLYTFASSGECDTICELFDANDNLLAVDDEAGNDNNFSVTYPLSGGKTYYFAVSNRENGYNYAILRIAKNSSMIFAGNCGENATWSLNALDGVLTISGTGDMSDYTAEELAPWFNCRSYIKSVSIGSKITRIGDYSFYYCTKLASFKGGAGITSVGSFAFARTGLTSYTAGESVERIEKKAFSYCSKLANVNIASVSSVAESAFEHCEALRTVSGGESVKTLSSYAFYGCKKLSGMNVYAQEIGNYAFSRSGIAKLALTNTKKISKGAFEYCNNLASVVVPITVEAIDIASFKNCPALTNVRFKGNAPSVKAAEIEERSFESGAVLGYYAGRDGWTDGTWHGYNTERVGLIGDVNGDNALTNVDLINIARYMLDMYHLNEDSKTVADMDGDGAISNSDLVALARQIVA